ncbi:hypothetical protein ACNQ2I_02115 [Mycoplasma sp. Z355B]|uniref:hypothetical protein n=1 Tax=unclassified Mycoplasma TaxID=2683645 RepID=UPI003AABA2B3
MKLKGILLTLSGLTLAATPALAISCHKPEQKPGEETKEPQDKEKTEVSLKTELNRMINSITNLEIKNKSQYTVDQLVGMDKQELSNLIEISAPEYDSKKYGVTVTKAEKKLNKDATAYDLDLTIQLFNKENIQITSFQRKFRELSGFNIAIEEVKALIANKNIHNFAKDITLSVENKSEILTKDVTKEQIIVSISPDAEYKDLYEIEIESFRPKAINTVLEVTLLILSKESDAKETVNFDIEGFKADKTTLNDEQLKEALSANIKDIELTVDDKKLFPSQVKNENIVASKYDAELFTFSILNEQDKPALEPQFKLDPFKYAKMSLKVRFQLTAKNNSEITGVGEYEITKGFPDISRSISKTPLAKTVESDPTRPEFPNVAKYLQVQYHKTVNGKKDPNAVTAFLKKDLDPINDNDPYKDIKSKYKDLRQKIIENLFVKSSDGTGSLMIVPNLGNTHRTFLTWILFTIDRQYYATTPKAELYQLFNSPLKKDGFNQSNSYSVDSIINIAKSTVNNGNI